jgi:hypothetical protein
VIVVLDTTALHGDVYAEGSWLATLFSAAAEHDDLEVWVPAAVVEELVRQFPERLLELRRKLRGHRHDVRAFGWRLPELPEDVETEAMAYRSTLTVRLRGRGRQIAAHPASIGKAVDWVAQRRKPAKSDGRGAVDAAIWLTVLEAAAQGSEVVLVSANTEDFADPADKGQLHGVLLADLDEQGIPRDRVRLMPRVLEVNKEYVEPSLEATEEAQLLLAEPSWRSELEDEIVAALKWVPIDAAEAGTWLEAQIEEVVLEDFLPETIHLVRADPLADGNFYATLEVRGAARLEVRLRRTDADLLGDDSPINCLDHDRSGSFAHGEAELSIWSLVEAQTSGETIRVSVEEIHQLSPSDKPVDF